MTMLEGSTTPWFTSGREKSLPVAMRGGGHNAAGLGRVDEGLMIDLSVMRDVRVDPGERTVRVGPGCTIGEVDHAPPLFGQAVPFGIISTTGMPGLTLNGGHSCLARQYGLACDRLIEADVVLADGRFVTAKEADNADLLWALRGGGGNFSVVTSFLFRIDLDPSKATELNQWARGYRAAVHTLDLEGANPSFMMDDEGEGRIRASYGSNYPRLAALEAKFDPDNLFRVNQNIHPAN